MNFSEEYDVDLGICKIFRQFLPRRINGEKVRTGLIFDGIFLA